MSPSTAAVKALILFLPWAFTFMAGLVVAHNPDNAAISALWNSAADIVVDLENLIAVLRDSSSLFVWATSSSSAVAPSVPHSRACGAQYTQCGGVGWAGPFCCDPGLTCEYSNDDYSQCLVASAPGSPCGVEYTQCAGIGWAGPLCCIPGLTCQYQNDYYSQCLLPGDPASDTSSTSASSISSTISSSVFSSPSSGFTTIITSSTVSSSVVTISTSSSPSTTSIAAPSSVSGKVKYAGINIAGFDFGCSTCGVVTGEPAPPPYNGSAQMAHFVEDDGLNAFRLPVTWQYLVNSLAGANLTSNSLDPNQLATYDGLVQACLSAGAALCIIDLHNYGRYNGAIIGQDGPTAAQFASIWAQLATKYQSESRIAFGLMNEPHDDSTCGGIMDISIWAATLQSTVTAIRSAGATTQMIILPGKGYSSPATYFDSDGSGPALLKITNPGGTTTGLVFEVHEYLDLNSSGCDDPSCDCVSNRTDTLGVLAPWLRQNGRQAFLTETGGLPTSQCSQMLCQELSYLNENSDVFLGWISWAAGSFAASVGIDETPIQNADGTWTDMVLVTDCVSKCFLSPGSC